MIRRPPRSTLSSSSAASDVYKRQVKTNREFMHLLTYHKGFIRGNYNTGFWEKNHTEIEKWLKEGITVK